MSSGPRTWTEDEIRVVILRTLAEQEDKKREAKETLKRRQDEEKRQRDLRIREEHAGWSRLCTMLGCIGFASLALSMLFFAIGTGTLPASDGRSIPMTIEISNVLIVFSIPLVTVYMGWRCCFGRRV